MFESKQTLSWLDFLFFISLLFITNQYQARNKPGEAIKSSNSDRMRIKTRITWPALIGLSIDFVVFLKRINIMDVQ